MIPPCVSRQPAGSQASVTALPRVQRSVTFPGYFSANPQGGRRAGLSSLMTALKQLQTVTLNTVVPTIRAVSETTFAISVLNLPKLNHSAIKVGEETHVKDFS